MASKVMTTSDGSSPGLKIEAAFVEIGEVYFNLKPSVSRLCFVLIQKALKYSFELLLLDDLYKEG